jgi:protein-tyrosine kinase
MGRIEDALYKLQARSREAGKSSPPAPTARLGALVPHEHTYGGSRIAIDSAQLRANGLLAPDSEERRLAEQYRTIKRPLLRNAVPNVQPPVPRGNLVMVASALSGEGKTFTCVNLCLSIARERDWDVVLVDGDCSKPHLTRLFAAENRPGLIDLLRDPALEFDDLVMPTDVPGFSILPAGARDSHASELLASKRMEELCDALASKTTARMIVFDSSPLLLTTEAAELAAHVGQVLVIVHANETPKQAVIAALEKLDESKAIGCVLNQAWGSGKATDGYGYYGYDDATVDEKAGVAS